MITHLLFPAITCENPSCKGPLCNYFNPRYKQVRQAHFPSIIELFSQKQKSLSMTSAQMDWNGASALTQSPNHWNPLKGLYLRNALLVSQKEDSGYKACQELQTGAKTEAVGLVVPMISLLNTQQKKLKKKILSGWCFAPQWGAGVVR